MKKELKLNIKLISPRNESEEKLAKAFSKILGKSDISANDDFFELGGNSLNAIKLISNLEKENISIEAF